MKIDTYIYASFIMTLILLLITITKNPKWMILWIIVIIMIYLMDYKKLKIT